MRPRLARQLRPAIAHPSSTSAIPHHATRDQPHPETLDPERNPPPRLLSGRLPRISLGPRPFDPNIIYSNIIYFEAHVHGTVYPKNPRRPARHDRLVRRPGPLGGPCKAVRAQRDHAQSATAPIGPRRRERSAEEPPQKLPRYAIPRARPKTRILGRTTRDPLHPVDEEKPGVGGADLGKARWDLACSSTHGAVWISLGRGQGARGFRGRRGSATDELLRLGLV